MSIILLNNREAEKKLRKLIQEIIGIVFPIDKLSSSFSVNVIDLINRLKNIFMKSNSISSHEEEFRFTNNIYKEKLSIKDITILIINRKGEKYENFKKNYVSGSFERNNTKSFTNTDTGLILFNVYININLYNWDYETDLSDQIEKVLSHELHHFYDYAKKLNKKSKSEILNNARNRFKGMYLNDNPKFKEFIDCFYLNLPQERNARVQEAYKELKQYENETEEQLLLRLNSYPIYNDLKRLREFDAQELINNTTKEEKIKFINDFNKSIDQAKIKLNIDKNIIYPRDLNNPDKFFIFWKDMYFKNANVTLNKIIKITKNIKQLNQKNLNEFLNNNKKQIIQESNNYDYVGHLDFELIKEILRLKYENYYSNLIKPIDY